MSELQRLRDRIEQLESLLGLDRNIAGRLRDAFMITRAQAETLCFMLRRNFVSHEALYITLYGARPDCDQPDPRIMDVQVHHLRTALRKHGIALKTRWARAGRFHRRTKPRSAPCSRPRMQSSCRRAPHEAFNRFLLHLRPVGCVGARCD